MGAKDWIIGGMIGPVPAAFGVAGLVVVLLLVSFGLLVRRVPRGGTGAGRRRQRVGR